MAKASDLIGKSGGSGFGPVPKPSHITQAADTAEQDKTKSHPIKDSKPAKPGKGTGGGGAPVSVRPKV